MADEQTEKSPEAAPAADAQAALDAAVSKLKEKKPRKPRAPRKKKGAVVEAPIETAQAMPAAEPAKAAVTAPESTSTAQTEEADRIAKGMTNGHVSALHREPIRRKSGRIPLDINLGPDEHVWERVISPDQQEIIFRFKSPVTEAQGDLIEKYGFQYDPQIKEASRPNDAAGRMHADKLAWYLKGLERSQQAAVSV